MKRTELDRTISLASAQQRQRWADARRHTLSLRDQALQQLRQSPVVFIGVSVLLFLAWRRLRRLRLLRGLRLFRLFG